MFRNERLMCNVEMPKLLKCGKIKKRFSHILTISWKSQFIALGYIKEIRLYGFSTFPHCFFLFIYKIFKGGFMDNSLRSYSKRKDAFRPLFLTLQGGGFIVK
jgi:hypothetical protein